MMKKTGIILSAALAAGLAFSALFVSCGSSSADGVDPAITKGIQQWNKITPKDAVDPWNGISDAAVKAKYLNYVELYKAGHEALESTDSMKASQETKLLNACNTALDKFTAIDDSQLKLPPNDCEKGANLSADRINKLLESNKITAAKTMHQKSVSVYGTNDALTAAGKEIDVVSGIYSKSQTLSGEGAKAAAVEGFEAKVAAYDDAIAKYKTAESEVDSLASKSGVAGKSAVSKNINKLKSDRQNLESERASVIREKAYEYKDKIGEEFARELTTGTGKKGAITSYDIRNHYNSIQSNIDKIYGELTAFAAQYPKDVGQDVLSDIDAQRKDLKNKIAQINREIANEEEIKSRGNTVMPLMIGLFNPDPKSTAESKKSRPAKFSSAKQKDTDYWWGMVSIPSGQMNDLVITLKDNRTVHVYNQNTHSGKDIKKKNLQDLVSKANKIGNSWPVMNVGKALNGGSNYYFSIEEGKTNTYAGEVVIYSSFVTRSR